MSSFAFKECEGENAAVLGADKSVVAPAQCFWWQDKVVTPGYLDQEPPHLPALRSLNLTCLRTDFCLSRTLVDLCVSVADPWAFMEELLALRSNGKLPILKNLAVKYLGASRTYQPPYVRARDMMKLTCLQGLVGLKLPAFKARPPSSMHTRCHVNESRGVRALARHACAFNVGPCQACMRLKLGPKSLNVVQ